jgi:hypothetical protein
VDTSYHHAASESPTFGHSHDPEKAALGAGIQICRPVRNTYLDGVVGRGGGVITFAGKPCCRSTTASMRCGRRSRI